MVGTVRPTIPVIKRTWLTSFSSRPSTLNFRINIETEILLAKKGQTEAALRCIRNRAGDKYLKEEGEWRRARCW